MLAFILVRKYDAAGVELKEFLLFLSITIFIQLMPNTQTLKCTQTQAHHAHTEEWCKVHQCMPSILTW